MVEVLKSNWFVVLIAIIILSFVVYFVYDENKYNVSGKSVDGHELLVSVGNENVTADQLFEESSKFDQSLLYQMYKIAVLNEGVELTSDMKSEAKTLESTIRTNFQSQYGDDYETTLKQQLANYGFSSENPLYDYCLTAQLEKKANADYIDAHFDEEAEILNEKSPRTISVLKISVVDPANLTEEEQTKKNDIDALIESDGFEAAVTAFSEDTNTVAQKGFLGFITSDDAQVSVQSQPKVDASVIQAALELEKDAVSDWVTVTDAYGQTSLYKVKVNETDLKTMFGNEDLKEDIMNAFLTADVKLSYNVIEELAAKVNVTFEDETAKQKIQDIIKGVLEDEEEVNE